MPIFRSNQKKTDSKPVTTKKKQAPLPTPFELGLRRTIAKELHRHLKEYSTAARRSDGTAQMVTTFIGTTDELALHVARVIATNVQERIDNA